MDKHKYLSMRIHDQMLKKFRYVANYEDRSANGQITFLINNCIHEFEEEHGVIELAKDENK